MTARPGARRHLPAWLCTAALLLASGCASQPPAAPTPASLPSAAGPWSGRLSLQVESEPPQGFHAGFELLGSAQAGELKLYTPLGATLASARWSADSALLLRGDDMRAYPDLATLTAALTGAALPVAELFEWLQGRPAQAIGWSVELGASDGRVRASRSEPAPPATLRLILDRPQQ
ncbi:lipoprotein insertase outer membrane protein LolB [Malikia sp.]|uniref:lipoprotein insertase outer membrane protein LolB n=1 Tax=Malikia sp. TaxID=2070706 RepID=UPI00260863E4|nr:lipoprotein insertase outer membrane protein LolB [Malikia sp.]MDD2730128.1 lipoprotein insertase outer membrane protein LolB [Malikia sp.]